ncbi:MAG TPA: hypothetical protein DHV48_04735 [Prolixibacteraceae bacterium]|nr:hypothetical protein [Prolixibacteraceae bacterium]
METYTASRLTEGNRIFTSKIIIDDLGVTFRVPSLFSGNERTIPFNRISSVDIDSPLIGYSTIIIETTGEGQIRAHGFTRTEVKEMKRKILEKIG